MQWLMRSRESVYFLRKEGEKESFIISFIIVEILGKNITHISIKQQWTMCRNFEGKASCLDSTDSIAYIIFPPSATHQGELINEREKNKVVLTYSVPPPPPSFSNRMKEVSKRVILRLHE